MTELTVGATKSIASSIRSGTADTHRRWSLWTSTSRAQHHRLLGSEILRRLPVERGRRRGPHRRSWTPFIDHCHPRAASPSCRRHTSPDNHPTGHTFPACSAALSLCRESGVRVSSGTLDPISCCGSGWTLVRPIELTSVSTWASTSCRGRRSGALFVRASQGALDGYSHKAVATPESDCSADLVCGSCRWGRGAVCVARGLPSVGLQGEAPMRRPVLTCGTHLLGTEEDSDEVHRAGAVGVRG